jgi:hypothetical protein
MIANFEKKNVLLLQHCRTLLYNILHTFLNFCLSNKINISPLARAKNRVVHSFYLSRESGSSDDLASHDEGARVNLLVSNVTAEQTVLTVLLLFFFTTQRTQSSLYFHTLVHLSSHSLFFTHPLTPLLLIYRNSLRGGLLAQVLG